MKNCTLLSIKTHSIKKRSEEKFKNVNSTKVTFNYVLLEDSKGMPFQLDWLAFIYLFWASWSHIDTLSVPQRSLTFCLQSPL